MSSIAPKMVSGETCDNGVVHLESELLFGYEDAAECKEECPKFCETQLNGILNSDQFRSACENNMCQCCRTD
ncbi:hypothetical protein MKW94_007957 [Papaver nudicaule]|uniref:Uncharacterized protein n=1 Tax=Papaver nudicaule TaxID=74823 RepID=A0AA42B379_PAPNU|nr:hypothetical protein [Papaver nudicaule]